MEAFICLSKVAPLVSPGEPPRHGRDARLPEGARRRREGRDPRLLVLLAPLAPDRGYPAPYTLRPTPCTLQPAPYTRMVFLQVIHQTLAEQKRKNLKGFED